MRFITLPSDSSMDFYPENTVAHYKTKLPQTINLPEGNFEVALVEINFPNNFQTVEVPAKTYGWVFTASDGTKKEYFIPAGKYASTNDILQRVKLDMTETGDPVVQIFPQNSTATMTFPDIRRLEPTGLFKNGTIDLLGSLSNVVRDGRIFKLTLHSTDKAKLRNLFVYCDLIQDQIVGDKTAPLLRIVPVTVPLGATQHSVYNRPHYMPLRTNSFHTVEISIRDKAGEKTRFEFGPLIVTLHLRRRYTDILL